MYQSRGKEGKKEYSVGSLSYAISDPDRERVGTGAVFHPAVTTLCQ